MASEPKHRKPRRTRGASQGEDPNPTAKEIELAFLAAADEALNSALTRAKDFVFAPWSGADVPKLDNSITRGILLAKTCAHYARIYGNPENPGAYGMILEMLQWGPETVDPVATEPFHAMYPHLPERTRLAYPRPAPNISAKKAAIA